MRWRGSAGGSTTFHSVGLGDPVLNSDMQDLFLFSFWNHSQCVVIFPAFAIDRIRRLRSLLELSTTKPCSAINKHACGLGRKCR